MIGTHRLIYNDVFDIASRIKQIDDGYFIAFCYKTKKFEVHHKGQRGSSLSLVLPFDTLDARTLSLVRQTRVERVDKLMRELDNYNKGNLYE